MPSDNDSSTDIERSEDDIDECIQNNNSSNGYFDNDNFEELV